MKLAEEAAVLSKWETEEAEVGLLEELTKSRVGELELIETLDLVRGAMVRESLLQSRGNISTAADILGVTRQAVQQLVHRLQLREWLRELQMENREEGATDSSGAILRS